MMIRGVKGLIVVGLLAANMVTPTSSVDAKTRLQGAGATFPAPLYKRLVVVYQELHPDVLIDYQSLGSGAGINSIIKKTVDFGASDAPMTKKELTAAGGGEHLVEIPTCAGGIVPIYNVRGVSETLRFNGEVLADIYLGKVNRWNDPAIAALNPNITLPDLAITPVWRTDGSGTTFIFTNYLATQSESFVSVVGLGKQVQWPMGQGGKGNEGVTAVVQQTDGGLGYVEQSYADNNKLSSGMVKNKDGKFVKATAETVSRAGAGANFAAENTLVVAEIWNKPGAEAYPIASFTYLIVYKDLRNLTDKDAAHDLVNFLWWATHEGQKLATELGYAPLAPEVTAKVEAALKQLTFRGEPLKIRQ